MIKPQHLKEKDTITTLSLSRWWPWACPERYVAWKKQLEDEFHVNIIEWKYTLKDPKWIYDHPEARAEDLMNAFKNPDIKAIISTIWWEESIRMLPFIDFNVISQNPKIFMWFSDSTITHFICHKAGIVSFYWPSIMAWFAENGWMFDYMVESVKKMLFDNKVPWIFEPNYGWRTNEFLPRNNPLNQIKLRKTQKATWWNWLQWNWIHRWELIWWCIDVFPFLQWTSIWPEINDWDGKILCLETSEEKMSEINFERIIRNLWSQWILHKISWILLWRSQLDYKTWIQISYEGSLTEVINWELWLYELPIITNMDFWHTDPMHVLPLWCDIKINCDDRIISFLEAPCV